MKKKLLTVAIVVGMLVPSVTFAQTSSLWKVLGNVLQPVLSTWSIRIPQLGSSGTPCVSVKNTLGDLGTTTCSGGGGSSPGGPNTAVQFNDSGSFGGSSGFTYNDSTTVIDLSGANPRINLNDSGNDAQVFLKSSGGELNLNINDNNNPLISSGINFNLGGESEYFVAGPSAAHSFYIGPDTNHVSIAFGISKTGTSTFNGDVILPATKLGIGTTTPWRNLSVVGLSDLGSNALAGYFTATTSTASRFPYASTTMVTAVIASTTNLNISGITGTQCLHSTAGVVSGTGSDCGSGAGTVSSVATGNGLTGGPITTTGTISLNTTGLSVNSLVTYNGTNLVATGTPNLTAGSFIATTSTASVFPYASTTAITASGSIYDTALSQGWVFTNGGVSALQSSTSPTVNYITSTSTTATSTFANGINMTKGCYAINGVCDVRAVTATSPITSSGGSSPVISTTLATNMLVGRGSAGTGVFEPITLGTNLSLSGTTLNASGGSTPPAGSDTEIQFNNAGSFGASSNFTFDGTSFNAANILTVGPVNPFSGMYVSNPGPSLLRIVQTDAITHDGVWSFDAEGDDFYWGTSGQNYAQIVRDSGGIQQFNIMYGLVDSYSTISVLTDSVGIKTGASVPPSMLSLAGNMSIGSTYGTTNAGPTDGLIVEGPTGIGTASPDSNLDVNGTVRFEGASSIETASIGGAIIGIGCDTADTSGLSGLASTTALVTTPEGDPGNVASPYSIVLNSTTIRTKVCSSVTVTPNTVKYRVKIIR